MSSLVIICQQPEDFAMFQNLSWGSVKFHEIPWGSVGFHEVPWDSMGFYEILWCSCEPKCTHWGQQRSNLLQAKTPAQLSCTVTISYPFTLYMLRVTTSVQSTLTSTITTLRTKSVMAMYSSSILVPRTSLQTTLPSLFLDNVAHNQFLYQIGLCKPLLLPGPQESPTEDI
jgi:hypothetical protein